MNRLHRYALGVTLIVPCLVACGDSTPSQPSETTASSLETASVKLAHNSWVPRAVVPDAGSREGVAAGVVANAAGESILYLIGGNYDQTQRDDIEAYNVATDTWTEKGVFPETVFSYGNGIGRIGNNLYFSGGYPSGAAGGSFGSIRNTLYAYDTRHNRVTRKADMPRHTADGITGVVKGKLYVLAGTCDDCTAQTVRRLYRYDPAENAWATLSESPHFHRAGAGAVINGKLYVAGGFDGVTGPTANFDVYNPATKQWKTLAPLPAPRVYAGAAALGGKLYIIGGFGPDAYDLGTDPGCPELSSCGHASVFAYDPATNKWKRRALLPTGRAFLAAADVTFGGHSGILAVGGGKQTSDGTQSPNDLYTP